jgi:hypothetical protein
MSHFCGIIAPCKTLPVDNALRAKDPLDSREDPENLSKSLIGLRGKAGR